MITLVGIELYIRNFEGWGAWAAAPLLLVPAVLSVSAGVIFIVDLIRSYRSGESIQNYLLLVIMALIPIGWLFVRRYFII